MKLTIKNIGKIEKAEVEIKGITVIAGENNTGKSTVGKSLWALFNGLYKINEQIYREKLKSIRDILSSFYRIRTNDFEQFSNYFDKIRIFQKEIFNEEKVIILDLKEIESKIKEIFNEDIQENEIKDVSGKILEILQLQDIKIIERIIQNRLRNEFNQQVSNIYSNSFEEILRLEIKDKIFEIKISNDKVIEVNIDGFLNTEAIYIDTPDVINRVDKIHMNGNKNHREQLEKKISEINCKKENIIMEISNEEKLQKIYSKLNKIIGGSFNHNFLGTTIYIEKNSDKELNIKNLSMGLKTFAILKILLENGSIKENGTIILDEPEIHLHPEWQLKFAELIVLLQKEFEMHILLTTHSPYFLEAIEIFAKKYGISENCRYYLTENKDKNAIMKDVTLNIEEIYKKLAAPFQKLENIKYE